MSQRLKSSGEFISNKRGELFVYVINIGKIMSGKNSKTSPQSSSRKITSSDKAPRKHSSLVMDENSSGTNKGVNLSSKF